MAEDLIYLCKMKTAEGKAFCCILLVFWAHLISFDLTHLTF